MLEIPLEESFDQCLYSDDYNDPDGWPQRLDAWLLERGLEWQCYMPNDVTANIGEHDYYMLQGSQRKSGVQHIVVMKNGKLAHDPLPGGDGDIEPETIWVFAAVDPAAVRTRGD